jgi:hypothetical protein
MPSKDRLVNLGWTVGAVVIGVTVFNMFVGPLISRMLAPTVTNVQQ